MAKVMIRLRRELGAGEGQRMLDEMARVAQAIGERQGGFTRLDVPGVTLSKNEFPAWLSGALESNDFEFDDLNLAFYREFKTLSTACRFKVWFDTEFRGFFGLRGKSDFLETVELRVMDDHDALIDKETF